MIGGLHQHDFDSLFPKLVALVEKIERWWVINVEIATDPDLMGVEIDEDGVLPGSQILLRVLAEVALGQDQKAWELYKQFMEQQGGDAH